jgi:hypothetical protein
MTQSSIERRYKGVQTFLTEGCLFLSLTSIAEQVANMHVDLLSALQFARAEGWIDQNNDMTEDTQCYYLEYLTHKKWHREVKKELPCTVPDEMYTVEKWLNTRTGKAHFRRRFVDTITDSITVKEGALVAYYCYSYES